MTTSITEYSEKMTCIFLSTNLPSISVIQKKLENVLLFSVIFSLSVLKIQKIRQNKWSLQFLIYLWLARFAHSRGFVWGSTGNLSWRGTFL